MPATSLSFKVLVLLVGLKGSVKKVIQREFLTYARDGQSAARETILCGPRALAEIYPHNVNQCKTIVFFFIQLGAESQSKQDICTRRSVFTGGHCAMAPLLTLGLSVKNENLTSD